MYKVRFTPEARADLDDIFIYTQRLVRFTDVAFIRAFALVEAKSASYARSNQSIR